MLYNNQDLLSVKQMPMGEQSFIIRGTQVEEYTLQDYQNEALKILTEIKRLCDKHQIQYFLMYGTLLGSIRHKGFIPWDDDADIVMTRDQYRLFSIICKDEMKFPYELIDYREERDYGYIFPRIRKKDSVYMLRSEAATLHHNVGIYVDIIILDYLSNHPLIKKIQIRSLLYLHRIVSPGFYQGKVHTTFLEEQFLRLIQFFIGRKTTISLIIKTLSCAGKKKSCEVLSNLLLPNRIDFLIYPKTHFDKSIKGIFEGVPFSIPDRPLTLLNLMYARGIRSLGYALEPEYGDEEALLGEERIWSFDDTFFIPTERQRDRHLEVLFDPENSIDHYTGAYADSFNKNQNDFCARKERRYRELSSKCVAIMEANSSKIRTSGKEVKLRDFLKNHCKWIAEKIRVQDFTELINLLLGFELLTHNNTTRDHLKFCMEIFMLSGMTVYAYRIAKRILTLYQHENNVEIEDVLKVIHIQFQFHLLMMQDEKHEQILDLVNEIPIESPSVFHDLFEGKTAFLSKDYDQAIKAFSSALSKNKHLFAPYYYMGLINEFKNDYPQAMKYYKTSLDTTTFMPYLTLSLERIQQLGLNECKE